jgi:hypothetical protein
MAEVITLPSGKMIRAYNGLGIIGSEEPIDGRDRQCGEPLLTSACLRAIRRSHHPLTVQSIPVSRQAWFSDRACFGRSLAGKDTGGLGRSQRASPRPLRAVGVMQVFLALGGLATGGC